MFVGLKEYLGSLESYIKENGCVRLPVSGTSMLPFLKEGRDFVLVEGFLTNLKKGDIVLYKRVDGSYSLHRLIGEENDKFLVIGDNQIVPEEVLKRNVIGVVTNIFRNERKLSKIYMKVFSIVWSIRVRKLYKYLRKTFRRVR